MLNCGSQSVVKKEECSGIMPGEVSLFYEISEILNSGETAERSLKKILNQMCEHLGMHRGGITLIGRGVEDVLMKVQVDSNCSGENAEPDCLNSVFRRIMISSLPVAVPDTESGFEVISACELKSVWSKENLAFFCVPIRKDNEIKGILSADHSFAKDLSSEQTFLLLSTIGGMISASGIYEEIRNDIFAKEGTPLRGENFSLNLLPSGYSNTTHFMTSDVFVKKAAAEDWSFFIYGKEKKSRELLAREIHYMSSRSEQTFIYCDCTKFAKVNGDIEIFGRRKSAFLGGMKGQIGLIDKGNQGTIFFDEIGCLSAETQARLLKLIEERIYYPLGSSESKDVDIRIIAGSARDLSNDSAFGKFNIGLYNSLNGYSVSISKEAEMESPLSDETELDEKDFDKIDLPEISDTVPLQESLDALEHELIARKLKVTRGNVSRAAEELGLTQRILGLRLKKYNIDYRIYRKRAG